MTNEEFQRIVLEELKGLREGQKDLELGQRNLEERQKNLELGQKGLEEGQKNLEKIVNAIYEQTAELTEFRNETKKELANIKTTISRIEIATADNWSDIARLKSII